MTVASYDPSHYADLARVEEKHFWFVHRNGVIRSLLARVDASSAGRVLEIGCGTGNVLRLLNDECRSAFVCGLEVFREGLLVARERTPAAVVQARIEALPFRQPFDIVGMFDVLEHLQDDQAALLAVREHLARGGRLLLTVPAYQWLWSAFDTASGHMRRYSVRTVRETLENSGFRISYITYFMAPIVPFVWAVRGLRHSTKEDAISRELDVSPLINTTMNGCLSIERTWLTSGLRLPFGTSIAVVAHVR